MTVSLISFSFRVPAADLLVDYDGKCVTLTGRFFGDQNHLHDCEDGIDPALPIPVAPSFGGFVVVQEGDRYFLSPARTALDYGVGMLQALQPENLRDFGNLLRSLFNFLSGDLPVPGNVGTLAPKA